MQKKKKKKKKEMKYERGLTSPSKLESEIRRTKDNNSMLKMEIEAAKEEVRRLKPDYNNNNKATHMDRQLVLTDVSSRASHKNRELVMYEPPPPPPQQQHQPIIRDIYINNGTNVGDRAEVVILYDDCVYDFRVPEPKVFIEWSAVTRDKRQDLTLAETARVITTPEGCAGYYLKATVTSEETEQCPSIRVSTTTQTIVACRTPVVLVCEMVLLLSDGDEAAPEAPMPAEILTFRYQLTETSQESAPRTKWFRNGVEIPVNRNRLNYKVTEADLGHIVKLQLTPVAPDGSMGTPYLASSGVVVEQQPVVVSVGMEGQLRPNETVTAKLRGRLLDLLDPPSFEWAISTGSEITRLAIGPSVTILESDVNHVLILKLTPLYKRRALRPVESRSHQIEPVPYAEGEPYIGIPYTLLGLPKNTHARWLARKKSENHQWRYLTSGLSYTPLDKDLGHILQIECTWVSGDGTNNMEVLETTDVTAPPPKVFGQPRILGEGVAGGNLKCECLVCEGGELQIIWERDRKDKWEKIAEGPDVMLLKSDVGHHIRVQVSAVVKKRVGPPVAIDYPSTISESGMGELQLQKTNFPLPTLTSAQLASWEISDDGCHTWQALHDTVFTPTADNLYQTVRGINDDGRETGRCLITIPSQMVSKLDSYVLTGLAGFGVKFDGKFSQLLLSPAGFKIHDNTPNSDAVHKVRWLRGLSITCLDDIACVVIRVPGSPPYLLSVLKPFERDLLVVVFRVFCYLAVPPGSARDCLPSGLSSAWRKGHTHGKHAREADKAALAAFISARKQQRFPASPDVMSNTFHAYLTKIK
eukprot:TRINITY_DN15852_c1_g1_i1.p1 TRINITY_DN15852_c1_g1~~TRINITY_DN15852_c1_g1_i1.p1  ORF type:complete len:812 (+),score=100.70 TRINITY_DN15852_c1_g1_i1:19-2454(+)